MGLIWRQRTRELSTKEEARVWKEKYDEVIAPRRAASIGAENYTQELSGWRPNEIDGRLIYEVSDRE